tara:strand:+ start:11707 stop:11817 length:111 start_codon:yes stop_codon:yes gene_type:complete
MLAPQDITPIFWGAVGGLLLFALSISAVVDFFIWWH